MDKQNKLTFHKRPAAWLFCAVVLALGIAGYCVYRADTGRFVFAVASLSGLGLAFIYKDRRQRFYQALYTAECGQREARNEIRSILYGIGDGVIATDTAGCVARMNPEAERLTGWSEAEAAGKSLGEIFRIVHEKTRAEVENPVNRVLREGVVAGLANHAVLIARDGTEYPIADSGAPIRDENESITGAVLVFRDQSVERKARKTLQESEEKYRLLAETARDIILVHDMHGRISYANESALKITGYSDQEARDMSIAELIPPEYMDVLHKRAMDRARGNDDIYLYEVDIIRRDGERLPVEINSAPIHRDGQMAGILIIARDITERKNAEETLRALSLRQEALLDAIPDIVMEIDRDGVFTWSNPAGVAFFGEHVIGKKADFYSEARSGDSPDNEILPVFEGADEVIYRRSRLRREDGQMRLLAWRFRAIRDKQGEVVGALSTARDITDIRTLEDQLHQARKMESVGRLAGGVAHDFNNMLQAILGYADLALGRIQGDDELYENIKEILKAAQRSADLTRQLLTFARKQTINPKVLDINDTVSGMLKILRRLIGEDIELVWKPGPDLWPVMIDPTQIDQILANISINARDAIHGVGKLTIETANAVLDETCTRTPAGLIPGKYVLVAVSDTGRGMSKETLEVLFEPFFTTKEVGRGTGLGLATVYGIVKQNHGFINVYSEPGEGTAFKIYLPRVNTAVTATPEAEEKKSVQGTETILLVEDEPMILNLGKSILERFGYTVLEAHTPGEALSHARSYNGPIHLLVTDVVMPEMNGKDLRDRLAVVRPDMKVLYMSGYTADVIAHHGVIDEGIRFLQKPFSVNSLASKVRDALEN